MITVRDLALRRGPRLLYSGVSFRIPAGAKVGLVGANGSGKSSLFAALRGELAPDAGEIDLPAGTRIAHVEQETANLDQPILEFVLDGDRALRAVQAELARAQQAAGADCPDEAAAAGETLARLHTALEALDGYSAPARAARLLAGLGFAQAELERPVSAFSGGWRRRLNLARALMAPADDSTLLLLDEPTNHLDLEAIVWLEQWLAACAGTVLLVSHDREFLDAVVSHVLHVEQGGMKLYSGHYSAFESRRAEQLAQQAALRERQDREIARVRAFVQRFGAKATRARQAQSRLKALQRMESVAPAHMDSVFRFHFPPPARMAGPLLGLREVAVGYGGRPLLRQVDLTLMPGDRVGLLGPNGAGKSSLVKLMAGLLSPLSGECQPANALRIGYFAQHQLELLDDGRSAWAELAAIGGEAPEQRRRDFLGGFGFAGDEIFRPVGSFSGGERARLVLALLVWQRPQLLLLDEPTNHLDLEMRWALELALQDFEGALVLVSHDRHLLRTVCDRLLRVGDGELDASDTDLDAYQAWLSQRRRSAAETAPGGPDAAEGGAARERRRERAQHRQRLAPLRARVRALEQRLEALGREAASLEARFAAPELYSGPARGELDSLMGRKRELDRSLAQTEAEWLQASEQLEACQPEA